ncbi:hypothetical protein QUB17_11590 [Microcoleus sp. B5-C4]|uniref:SLOG cluster 4 domain-containing protein n=1 Tax=Microcoleus sp. B5-C4 TaxID=2818675 RepID=UPI002FD63648
MQHQVQIGVVGFAGEEEYPNDWKMADGITNIARSIGKLIALKGGVVVTGGGGGVMAAAATGAMEVGGFTLAVINTLRDLPDCYWYSARVVCGMAEGGPEFVLPLTCDALIVIGGGAGTLNEIAVAYRNSVPIVLLAKTGGWCDRLTSSLIDNIYLDERRRSVIFTRTDAEEAVSCAFELGIKKIEQALNTYSNPSDVRDGHRKIFD